MKFYGRRNRLIEYYTAIAEVKRLSAQFAEDPTTVNLDEIKAARSLLRAADVESERDRMLPALDVAALTGYSRSQISRLCRIYGPGSGDEQIRAEKRGPGRGVWYLLVEDVLYLREAGEIQAPRGRDEAQSVCDDCQSRTECAGSGYTWDGRELECSFYDKKT